MAKQKKEPGTKRPTPKKQTLLQKMLEVKKSVDFLKKKEENKPLKFKYVSSSQVLTSVRDKMNELGIFLVPVIEGGITGTHGTQLMVELNMTFHWVNVEDPTDCLDIPWFAVGLDIGERGIGKALTYAEKFHILKIFNIPTDESDPDALGNPTTPASKPRKPAKAKEETPAAEDGPELISKAQKKALEAWIGKNIGKGEASRVAFKTWAASRDGIERKDPNEPYSMHGIHADFAKKVLGRTADAMKSFKAWMEEQKLTPEQVAEIFNGKVEGKDDF